MIFPLRYEKSLRIHQLSLCNQWTPTKHAKVFADNLWMDDTLALWSSKSNNLIRSDTGHSKREINSGNSFSRTSISRNPSNAYILLLGNFSLLHVKKIFSYNDPHLYKYFPKMLASISIIIDDNVKYSRWGKKQFLARSALFTYAMFVCEMRFFIDSATFSIHIINTQVHVIYIYISC